MTFRPLSSVSTRVGIRPVARRAGDIKLPDTRPVSRTRAGAERLKPELVVPLPAGRYPSGVLLFHSLVKGFAIGDHSRWEPSESSPPSPPVVHFRCLNTCLSIRPCLRLTRRFGS